MVDPFMPQTEIKCYDSSEEEYEKDSQDSNRESAEQNDYPDEELMVNSDGKSVDSDRDFNEEN